MIEILTRKGASQLFLGSSKNNKIYVKDLQPPSFE